MAFAHLFCSVCTSVAHVSAALYHYGKADRDIDLVKWHTCQLGTSHNVLVLRRSIHAGTGASTSSQWHQRHESVCDLSTGCKRPYPALADNDRGCTVGNPCVCGLRVANPGGKIQVRTVNTEKLDNTNTNTHNDANTKY